MLPSFTIKVETIIGSRSFQLLLCPIFDVEWSSAITKIKIVLR